MEGKFFTRKVRKFLRNLPLEVRRYCLRFKKSENERLPELLKEYLQEKQQREIKKEVFGIQRYFVRTLKNFFSNGISLPKFKRTIRPVMAGFLILILVLQILIPRPSDIIYGATYTFTQNSWTSADTVSIVSHPSGQSEWYRYYSASSITSTPSGLGLKIYPFSWTNSTQADFNAGTHSNTYVSGNSVKLLKPLGSSCSLGSECSSSECVAGTCMSACGSGTLCGQSCSYGSVSYPTVLIAGKCWTTKSLEYGNLIQANQNPSIDGTVEKWCVDSNGTTNCTINGAQYSWAEANQFENACDTTSCSGRSNPNQGVCPYGWHIPTVAEWSSTGASPAPITPALNILFGGYKGGTNPYLMGGGTGYYWAADEYASNLGKVWHAESYNNTFYDDAMNKLNGAYVRCIKNSITTAASVSVSPASLTFSAVAGNAPANQNISISNPGGATLSWIANTDQDHCNLSAYSGNTAAGGSTNVTVSVSAKSSVGSFPCNITVKDRDSANYQTVSVSFSSYTPAATINRSPTTLSFNGTADGVVPNSKSISINNSGTLTLNWTASTNASWCTVSKSSSSTPAGGTNTILVSVSGTTTPGTYNCGVTISDPNSSNLSQSTAVTYIAAAPNAILSLERNTMSFSSGPNIAPAPSTLMISNGGNTNLNWTATTNQPTYCSVSPTSGSVAPSNNNTVTISMAARPAGGSYPCTVTFTGAPPVSNSPQNLSITYSVVACTCTPGTAINSCTGYYNNGSYSGNVLCASDCTSADTSQCTLGGGGGGVPLGGSCSSDADCQSPYLCNIYGSYCDTTSGSCPYLYSKIGNAYVYSTDLMNQRLGAARWNVTGYQPGLFDISKNPVSEDGKYKFKIREVIGEVDYFDRAQLWAVDVPSGYSVFTDFHNSYNIKGYTPRNLYTVKNPKQLVSAIDRYGKNVFAELHSEDDVAGPENASTTNYYTLDFGNIEHPEYAKLIVYGWDNYENRNVTNVLLYPDSTGKNQNTIVETIGVDGQWHKVKEFGTMAGDTKATVFEIAGVWQTNDHRVRIHPSYRSTGTELFDKIELDDSIPVTPVVTKIEPALADLHYRGSATTQRQHYDKSITAEDDVVPTQVANLMYGYFTKYGDVSALLGAIDDKFVIMRHGDELSLEFHVPAQAESTERKLFMYGDVYYSVKFTPQGDFMRDVSEPLPFHGMSQYPYNTSTENYPLDAEHVDYINQWNTRYCSKDAADHGCEIRSQNLPGGTQPTSGVFDIFMDRLLGVYDSVFNTVREMITLPVEKVKSTLGSLTNDFISELLNPFGAIPVYAASSNFGVFISQVGNLGSTTNVLTTFNWTESNQAGTSILMQVRAGNTATPDATWTSWSSIVNGGSLSAFNGKQYIQYKAVFASTQSDSNVSTLTGVSVNYNRYATTGSLISSVYDSGDAGNAMGGVYWNEAALPSGTAITVSIRTANNSAMSGATAWSDYNRSTSGCTNNSGVIDCPGSTIPSTLITGGDDRYFQYKVSMTSGGNETPYVSEVRIKYVVNAPPEIRNVAASQNSDGSVSISYEARSTDTVYDTNSVGLLTPSFQYCQNGGGTCSTLSALSAGATSSQAVNLDGTTWTTFNTIWRPASDTPNVWDQNATVRVTVDDKQALNNLAFATSSVFTLDTIPPAGASFNVDATSTPATLFFAATDTSTPVRVRYGNSLDALAGSSWSSFSSFTTLSITEGSTVYAQYKDAVNNTTGIFSVTVPETPTGFMIQDTSNMKLVPNEYRLFLAWKVVASPAQGAFGGYKIYRSTSASGPWTLRGTVTDITQNYYADNNITSPTTPYYYKVLTVDSLGNSSLNSSVLNAMANGIQDLGEGGGGTSAAPIISNVATSSVNGTSAIVSWNTDNLSNSSVSFSTSPSTFTTPVSVSSMADNASGIGQHEVLLSGLNPATTYYFSVSSANNQGQLTTDNNGGPGYSFTTTPGPSISTVNAINIGNTAATITWTTDIGANSVVYYATSTSFASAGTVTDNNDVTTHSVTLPTLEPGTKYYYYVRSTGGGGYSEDKNIVSGIPQYYSFSTTNDLAAPTFSNFSSTPATSSAVVIFQTSKDGDTIVDYGPTPSFGSSTILETTLTKVHSATIFDLTPSTLYYWRARSTDNNGNEGTSANQSFTTLAIADTNPPVITNLATSSVALNRATISWDTNKLTNGTVDFGTTLAYGNLVGNLHTFASSSHEVVITDLAGNTLYYFRVNSADSYGNTASSTGSFTTVADQTPPVIVSSSTLANDTAAFINWTTDELAYGEVDYATDISMQNPIIVESTTTLYTNHSMPLTGLVPSSSYYYTIKTADPSANTTTVGPYSLTTLGAGAQTIVVTKTTVIDNTRLPDSTLPIITNVRVNEITPFSATVSWTTDKESSSLVKYGKSMDYGSLAGDFITFGTVHSVLLSNLTPGTTYNISAASIDKFGNIGTSPNTTFSTLNIDGTATVPNSNDNKEVNQEAERQFIVEKVLKAPLSLLNSVLDAVAGNPFLKEMSEESAVKSLGGLIERLGQAPTIVGLRPQIEVHGNAATVRWSTDKKTTGLVSYAKETEYVAGSDRPYTTSIVDSDSLSTVHTVELPSLEPATRYHFQVASKGEIGPEARSKDYTFETEAILPEVSDAKVTDVKATEATVSWKSNVPTASNLEFTNLSTTKTLLSGDPALLITHVFTLKNLEPGSKYSLTIKAKNESGQESSSNPLTFETIIDKDAPKVLSVSANSTLYPGANAKVQTIVSWDTDEMAESQLFYQEGVADTDNVKSLPIDTTYSNKHFVVLTAFKPGSVYKYWIESTDQSGNKGKSESFTTLTPTEKQTIIDIISNNFQSVFGWTKNMGL
jgi:hypothetical protein